MSVTSMIADIISYFKLDQASDYERYLNSAACDKDLQAKIASFNPAASFTSFLTGEIK